MWSVTCTLPTGERPRQPGVDGAEAQVAVAGAVDVVEQPGELGGRLVRGQGEVVGGLGRDALADRAQVLPAERRGDRLARRAVPDDRAGPLVGDADGGDRLVDGVDDLGGGVEHQAHQRHGVELDEPGERGRRRERPRCHRDDRQAIVDGGRADAGRADVEHEDRDSPFG